MDAVVMRERIITLFAEVWQDEKPDLSPPEIADDLVLLDTGLDSMGYAIFVSRLDEELGYDPFALHADAFYPQTFGEFVGFYEKYLGHAA